MKKQYEKTEQKYNGRFRAIARRDHKNMLLATNVGDLGGNNQEKFSRC